MQLSPSSLIGLAGLDPALEAMCPTFFAPHFAATLGNGNVMGIIGVVGGLSFTAFVIVSTFYFQHRKRQLWHETARLALEKGQPLPALPHEDEERENRPPPGVSFAHNHWRNARRRHEAVPLDPKQLEVEETTPSASRLSDLQQDLSRALQRLAPDEQTAVHLCYQQGLSHREIADVLGWPLGTVKTHLARSKEKLRSLLASWNPQT
ncbi:MAG: sigma-70 family RNA polymerase sigma factor [Opitutaceae bacterium]|nr:sigma-70 family RNA polymerase sigma factor [Opitutaceae bacterium]